MPAKNKTKSNFTWNIGLETVDDSAATPRAVPAYLASDTLSPARAHHRNSACRAVATTSIDATTTGVANVSVSCSGGTASAPFSGSGFTKSMLSPRNTSLTSPPPTVGHVHTHVKRVDAMLGCGRLANTSRLEFAPCVLLPPCLLLLSGGYIRSVNHSSLPYPWAKTRRWWRKCLLVYFGRAREAELRGFALLFQGHGVVRVHRAGRSAWGSLRLRGTSACTCQCTAHKRKSTGTW